MNSFKIRFSDVLRYFILGGIELLLYCWLVDKSLIVKITTNEITTLQIALACIIIYLLGFITQSIIQLFFGGDFLGTGLGETAEYIRFFPRHLPNRRGYPDWLYWSDRPRRVLEIYRNVLETDESAENKTEFLYSNQLFQGTAFAVLISVSFSYINSLICVSTPSKCLILAILLFVLWLVHWWCGQSERVIISFIIGRIVAPFSVFFLASNTSLINGLVLFASFLMAVWLAESLARKQIRRVDILARFNSESAKKFSDVLARVGVPKFYILTRTNSAEYITEELQSIKMQTYPNIKVILLIDSSLQGDSRDDLFRIVESFRDAINIQTYESSNSGPAALAYEIRQIFINYANEDDIAMILDSDDKLYSPSVVSQIMTKLFRTQSNICLIRFEIFGKQNLNYSKNYHNDLVKKLCYSNTNTSWFREEPWRGIGTKKERVNSITPKQLLDWGELHHVSTIGWTKCYRKGILEAYHNLVKDYLANKMIVEYDGQAEHKYSGIPDIWKILKKYEDFPDIIALMLNRARICAVAKNSVLFRKSSNSVTTDVTSNNYDVQIPYFLHVAKELFFEK